MIDDDDLTPEEAARLRLMIRAAGHLARISEADELAILERLAAGDRAGADRIAHRALTVSMMNELSEMLDIMEAERR